MILIISAMQEEAEEINKMIDDREEVLLNDYLENKKFIKENFRKRCNIFNYRNWKG